MTNEYDARVDKAVSDFVALSSELEKIEQGLDAKLREIKRARQRLSSSVSKHFNREATPTSLREFGDRDGFTKEYVE